MELVDLVTEIAPDGAFQVRALPPHETLGGFLNSDVQYSDAAVDSVLAWVDRSGDDSDRGWQGNAYMATISAGIVTIECLYVPEDDPYRRCRMPRAEFREAVEVWQRAFREQFGRS